MNEKSRRLIYTTGNNLEIAKTSRDTGKIPLINYKSVTMKKRKIFEKKQESLEYTGTWSRHQPL